MKEIIVPKKYDGKKLNTFLLDSFDGLTLNLLYKALRKKDIRVNDQKISENVLLHAEDHIKIYLTDEQLYKNPNCSISIVYEDENIVVVNKPANIEVVGEHSLTSSLISYYFSYIFLSILCILFFLVTFPILTHFKIYCILGI